MKGLIIKDLYCLRGLIKGLTICCVVSILAGVLISLSTEYGNIALAMEDLAKENGNIISGTGESKINEELALVQNMIMLFTAVMVCLPVLLSADSSSIFSKDEDADFRKMLYSFPVSAYEIVGSRYLVLALFALVCFVISVITTAIGSVISPVFDFMTLFGWCVSFWAFSILYRGTMMCVLYFVNFKKTQKLSVIPLLVAAVLVMIIGFRIMNSENAIQQIEGLFDLIEGAYVWLLPIALLVYTVTFFVNVNIVKRRRGAC